MEKRHEVEVWDLFVRAFHWILFITFAICFATEGKPRWLHVYSGYVIAALIPMRVLWGFTGPRYARFSDFVRSPKTVLLHLKEIAAFRSRRFLGHDPAGGAMIIALLVTISLTVLSGLFLYGVKDKAGPFAGSGTTILEGLPSIDTPAFASKGDAQKRHGSKVKNQETEWMKEIHETFANAALVLVCLHICGVLVVSFQTRENLVGSMISGRKKSNSGKD